MVYLGTLLRWLYMWLANHITSVLGLASYHSYLSVHGIMELKDCLLKANQALHNT